MHSGVPNSQNWATVFAEKGGTLFYIQWGAHTCSSAKTKPLMAIKCHEFKRILPAVNISKAL